MQLQMELHYFQIATLPRLYDIAWCLFPDGDPSHPGPKLRPVLVRRTLMDPETRRGAVEVSYGTTKLKLDKRGRVDLIIQNATTMGSLGLPMATRFDLDLTNILPWCEEFFCVPEHAGGIVTGRLNMDDVTRYRAKLKRREEIRAKA